MSEYTPERRYILWTLVALIALVSLAGCNYRKATEVSFEEEISLQLTQLAGTETAFALVAGDGGGDTPAQDLSATETALAAAEGQMVEATVAVQQTAIAAQQTAEAQAAQATADLEAQAATATFQAPVVAELPTYGVNPENGHLAWVHQPVTLHTEGFMSDAFANDYIQIPVKDFVIASDITWDTKYGDSGCGFILRSDGNPEDPSQYVVIISRSATGHAYYLAQFKGDVFNFRNWYGNILWRNGTTNRLAVVMRGPILEVYANGALSGRIDTSQPPPPLPELPFEPEPPKKPPGNLTPQQQQEYNNALALYDVQMAAFNQLSSIIKRYHSAAVRTFTKNDAVYEEGLVGMFAFAYSGYVTCDYDNTWLWMIDN